MNFGKLGIVKKVLGVSALIVAGLQASHSYAIPMETCGSDATPRMASLGIALDCSAKSLGHTVHDSELDTWLGGSWTEENDWLTIVLTSGSWGGSPAAGTWSINPLFWDKYGKAAITMHVGGIQTDETCTGKGKDKVCTPTSPVPYDNFAWLIGEDEISGEWSYTKNFGSGGGLSNIKLWGSGEPTSEEPPPPVRVPEPSSVLLFALGLLGLVVARKKVA